MTSFENVEHPVRGVLILDKNNCAVYANNRTAEIFGKSISEIIGSSLSELLNSNLPANDKIIEEVLSTLNLPDKTIHRFSAPYYDKDGNIAGRVEIYSDITARRELEQEIIESHNELAQLNQQLQEAQERLIQSERLRTLGEMAAGVAHDINNVLGIILGNAQLAKRKIDSNHPCAHSIDAIELAARDAAETVRRLREIGKPAQTGSYKPIDLSDIASDIIKTALPAWNESGSMSDTAIEVKTSLVKGCFVMGNASELREALANVLLNAAQAIADNGKIEISTRYDDKYAYIDVIDDGIGMTEETRLRLFDPFFTTRGAEGTGLGMSMVDAVILRHGGKVLVESKESEGTIVTLRLPLYKMSKDK
ncbi:MAG: ATP-binding protein [Armatimonadota bacterium]